MSNFHINELRSQLQAQKISLQEISDFLPCYTHINSLEDFSVLEVDSKIENYFDMVTQEINQHGFDLLEQYIHHQDLSNAIVQNLNYLDNSNEQSHVTFLQRIYFPTLKNETIFYTIGQTIDSKRILNISIPIQELKVYNQKLSYVFEHSSYIRRYQWKFNLLTKREIELCAYLCQENSVHEIGIQLNISRHTIKNHKINIYKKLEVTNFYEFYTFCRKFNIHR